MKKISALIVILVLLMVLSVALADGVKINKKNFPDANFRKCVKEQVDKDNDGTLSKFEILSVTYLDCMNNSIIDLKGIEYFINLEELHCGFNQLTKLDVSNNTKLRHLQCGSNELTSLDLSKNVELLSLYCSYNPMTSLDVRNNIRLSSLYCRSDPEELKELDISNIPALVDLALSSSPKSYEFQDYGWKDMETSRNLIINRATHVITESATDSEKTTIKSVKINKKNFPDAKFRKCIQEQCDKNGNGVLEEEEILAARTLDCSEMNIKDLKGVEFLVELIELNCYDNKLTSLDLSNNKRLVSLICADNQLKKLDLRKNKKLEELRCSNNALTNLDLSKNTKLTTLYCSYNALTNLDLSKNTELIMLSCPGNALTNLDLSKNTELITLYCSGNALTNLDLSKNTRLMTLDCSSSHRLTGLNVKKNKALVNLNCFYCTELKKLDVSKNVDLEELDCSATSITELNVSNNTKLKKLTCAWADIKKLDISHNPILLKLNKEKTGAKNDKGYGWGWWKYDKYGDFAEYLLVNKDVKIITK